MNLSILQIEPSNDLLHVYVGSPNCSGNIWFDAGPYSTHAQILGTITNKWTADTGGYGLHLQNNNKVVIPRAWLEPQTALTVTIELVRKTVGDACLINYHPVSNDRLTVFLYPPTTYNGLEVQSHNGGALKPAVPIDTKDHHIYSIIRQSNGGLKLFFDGYQQTLVGAGDSIGSVMTTDIEIGARGSGYWINGHISCIIIHKRELTEGEINNLHFTIRQKSANLLNSKLHVRLFQPDQFVKRQQSSKRAGTREAVL
ncbi:MAG: hypothetical protein KatS3mg087_2058 [Patescibacteria group bacterium]|nr:MAG: hypothetical protein KatS3mg087_2058 [Patescibacteria group bacterium]